MTLSDLGALGSFLAAIAVFITLVYLARQVKQGNKLARYQARQSMMEQDLSSLRTQIEHPGIPLIFTKDNPTEVELLQLHLFLTSVLRQREWEWFQFKDGIIDEHVYQTYHEVIAIFLGVPRTRQWWARLGPSGFNPEFVAGVNALLARSEMTRYWDEVKRFIITQQTHISDGES